MQQENINQHSMKPENQVQDFSLMESGVFYKLLVKLKLTGPHLEHSGRKILALICITWLPLFILAWIHSTIPDLKVPFLKNIEVHIRFLAALPIFVLAEVVANKRIRMLIKQFYLRKITNEEDLPLLNKAIQKATRLADSKIADAILVIMVFTLGNWFWGMNFSLNKVNTWYAIVNDGVKHFTNAGDWYAFVSVPIFQYLLIRWVYNLFVFGYLLNQISKLNLRITPIHPDRSGGIGFLVDYLHLITPFVFALSTLSAGGIADKIFFEGTELFDFRFTIFGFVVSSVAITISPLLLFIPKLYYHKRKDFREYGILSTRYVHDFYDKWIAGKNPNSEPLLGTPDIQSLADLDGSYSIARDMRAVPFTFQNFTALVLIACLPFVPLLLTVMSVDKLAEWLFNTLF
jgi:hypothetical protein